MSTRSCRVRLVEQAGVRGLDVCEPGLCQFVAAKTSTQLPTGAARAGRATTTDLSPEATRGEITRKLSGLRDLSPEALRAEWRRLYRTQPPRLSPDMMMRAIAYRVQEIAYGGLSKATRRRLKMLAASMYDDGNVPATTAPRLRPGTRLVREWRGRTHTVIVTETGFDYRGKTYPSLTHIAKVITRAHWSGPRFFGLVKPKPESASAIADV